MRHRAADRGRLLLRLRGGPSLRPGGSRRDRGQDARARRAGSGLRAQDDVEGGGEALLRRPGRAAKGAAGRGEGRSDRLVLHHRRRVHGLLHRPSRAVQWHPKGVPRVDELERILEGGCEEPADATDLRHGVLHQQGAAGAPDPPRGGKEAGPPQAGARARAVHLPQVGAGCRLLARARHDTVEPAGRLHAVDAVPGRIRRTTHAARV